MQAVVYTRYGTPEVLKVKDITKPVPKANELLIKVKTASISTADSMMRSGKPWFGRLVIGWCKPKHSVPGTGFAGIIEAVGKDITQFNVNDQVFGETSLGFGAHAEYLCLHEDDLILHKPEHISFDELAPLCDGALTSYSFLTDICELKKGQRILINGAAGSLGSAAVQIAHKRGAHVTGVCSASNIEFVKSLGAHEVIDYIKDDFTSLNTSYDVIFDTIGKSAYCACRAVLRTGGTYLSPVLSLKLLFQMMMTSFIGSTRAKFSATGLRSVKELKPLLQEICQMVERGQFHTVISQRFKMDQITQAHQLIDSGHKKGNIILKVSHH